MRDSNIEVATDKTLDSKKEECVDEKKEFASIPMHSLIDDLLHKCINVKSSKKMGESRFNECHWSFIIGRNMNAIGAKHFFKQHNFFKDRGVCEGDKHDPGKPQGQKNIYNLVDEFLVMVDAKYVAHKCYCLLINTMSLNK